MTEGSATSRIARLVSPSTFEVGEQEVGDPSTGQVRVRVLACGVCASELHAVEETLDSYPVSMGHEPSGSVNRTLRDSYSRRRPRVSRVFIGS